MVESKLMIYRSWWNKASWLVFRCQCWYLYSYNQDLFCFYEEGIENSRKWAKRNTEDDYLLFWVWKNCLYWQWYSYGDFQSQCRFHRLKTCFPNWNRQGLPQYNSSGPATKERMDKRDYMKLKSFCTTKEMVHKLKRPPTEQEKLFASYT
jgi:hypothetical protein